MLDIKSVQEEAQKEITEEKSKKAKEQIKEKLRSIAKAETIVANLKRELDELYSHIGAGIN